jgi:hypothetical protein
LGPEVVDRVEPLVGAGAVVEARREKSGFHGCPCLLPEWRAPEVGWKVSRIGQVYAIRAEIANAAKWARGC